MNQMDAFGASSVILLHFFGCDTYMYMPRCNVIVFVKGMYIVLKYYYTTMFM